MVTKKTRWLSAFAAMIMLVSMLAGIILPAGAATNSAILTALEAKYNALEQESFVEIKGKTVDEMRAQIAELIENYNQADNKYEREIYEQIGTLSDDEFMDKNKGNLVPGLIVRYALKDFYEQMGYSANASTYYISTVEDWEAAAASGSMFSEKNLLVTNDIDFKGEPTLPLTADVLTFQGVLDGQGHKFIDFCLNIGGNYKYCGIVADLSGGTIKNLGVEGGTISFEGYDVGGLSNEGVGTFAGYIGKKGLIQNCWSTATLTTSKISDGKNGIGGIAGWGEGGVIDNCFFAGTINNTHKDAPACDILGYGANFAGTHVKVYNSIGAGTLNCNLMRNPAAVGVMYAMFQDAVYFPVYNTYSVGHRVLRYRTNLDPVAAGYVTLPDFDITFTKDIVHKFTPDAIEAAYKLNSLEEAVWAVNGRFDTTHQPTDRDYYISLNEEGELYMSKTPEYFRKVTVEGSDSGVFYLKEGTTVNLVTDLGFYVAESITVDQADYASAIDGQNITIPASDITLTIKYSDDLALNLAATKLYELIEKYKYVTAELFKNGNLAEEWVVEAKKELAKDPMSIEGIEMMIALEESFGPYVSLKDGVYPKYTDEAKYIDFNPKNNWSISTTADWFKMIEESLADPAINYKNYTFYVTNDIDFENQKMDPLCLKGSFAGHIEGNGHAFKNINVYTNDLLNNVGLISKLAADAVINNFGVDSGKIESDGSTWQQGSTFGALQGAAKLSRVWSGATIQMNKNADRAMGIVCMGIDSKAVVNGAYFFGDLICLVPGSNGEVNEYTIAGENARLVYLYNTLSAPVDTTGIDGVSKIHNASNAYYVNNFAVGIAREKMFNFTGTGGPDQSVNCGSCATVLEAAWEINNNQPATKDQEPIYYTLNENGDVRFGDATNRIFKVTIMDRGNVLDVLYVTPGTYELDYDGVDAYTVSGDATVSGNVLTLGASDAVVTCNHCEHENGTIVPNADGVTHTIDCPDCNVELEECVFDGTPTPNDDLVIKSNGMIQSATHSYVCKCGNIYSEDCEGTNTINKIDCTQDRYYVFECCGREDAPIVGKHYSKHSFSSTWVDEGDGKESSKCSRCEVKQYRVVGKVETEAQSAVSAGSTVEVLVSTPVAMTEGTFSLSFMSNFTITKVEGEGFGWTAGTKVVTVTAPVAAGASFKVTLKADKVATVSNSTFDVNVTGAKDGDVIITGAAASTEIIFEKILGDADGDLAITLMDPVLVLQYLVDSRVAINRENANVDAVAGVSVNDVIAIVRLWLKTSDV